MALFSKMGFFKKLNIFENKGYCPTCTSRVTFVATKEWFRDFYICSNCGSIPRERAIMVAIETYFPEWKNLVIHESSPVNRGASARLARECKNYVSTQFFPGEHLGSTVEGIRCENLEALTFPDESIDIHITQDVMEHIFKPSKAFSEIARSLKPGGAHIFTVPLVNKMQSSEPRAAINEEGRITFIKPEQYHGNPVSQEGSLVTVDWGFDICDYIFKACGLFTHILYFDDISRGIRAEYIEVLITFKPLSQDHLKKIP